MDPLSLGAAGIGAIGSLFGGGKGGSQDLKTQIVTPPRPDLTGAGEPALQAASAAQMGAFAPFAQYGAGYQLMPQQTLGQVYVPGPNQTLIGNPYDSNALANFFGTPPPPPQQQAMQPSISNTTGAGKGMGQPADPGMGHAMGSLMQLSQNSSNMVGNRPSNQGPMGGF